MAQTIFPHLVAPPAAVQADAWFRLQSNGAAERMEGHLAEFDAGTALKLVRAVKVDAELVRRKCELARETRISVLGQWYSLRTELRGTGKPADLATGEDDVEVMIEIPPAVSGGTLVLRTCMILDAPAELPRSPFAATRAGSILWQDRVVVVLEGKGPRFPVEIRQFESSLLSDMGWMLDWRPSSPEAMFMGSVRLLLNERNKAVVEAARSANRDLSQKMILSAINTDVARSLISGMLRNPEFISGDMRYEKGTVGQVVGDLIASTFPREDLNTVSMQLANEPETFAARLQARFRIFSVG